MAEEAGNKDKDTLLKVITDLTDGAKIGCEGRFRDPSISKNAIMAYDSGEQVSDAIADWVSQCYE